MHKNNIQAILHENGIVLSQSNKNHLFSSKHGMSVLEELQLSEASRTSIDVSLQLFWCLEEAKEKICGEIFLAGEPLKEKVKLLMTIRGISALIALAFLADVGDIGRFKSVGKMNAYLGVVPKAKDSGGKTRPGHINRESRKLTRTLLTQSLIHIADASSHFRGFYAGLKYRRGAGRARIALIRKLCGIMRRMLLSEEDFRNKEISLSENKQREYEKKLEKLIA
jgi:hypothetical protein